VSYETDLNNNELTIRMKALSGSFTVDNSGGSAKTLTVTVKNLDPDYVTVSNGTVVTRGANYLVFLLNIPADASVTVNITPWYTPSNNNFYFIAWGDNQDGDTYFKNKLLPKVALINPIMCAFLQEMLPKEHPPQSEAPERPEHTLIRMTI